MVDNVTLPGTGEIVATDDVGGAQYQLIKLVDATVNSTTPIGTTSNPLPAALYGEAMEALEAMRFAIQALTRTVGLVQPDTAARMRVAIDSISANLTLSSVSNVGTLTNQSQIGGYSAVEQIPALMRMSADSLRRNITVS
jgi:hypothetical protein